MQKLWTDIAWEDYLYWQTQDKKTLRRINNILKDIDRSPFDGIGKPEPLKGDLQEYSSVNEKVDHRAKEKVYQPRVKKFSYLAQTNFRGSP